MSAAEILPAPMTPPDCNLRGFQWMPIDTVRLLDSDLFLLATGDEFKAALALWCKSWSQVPAASLPADERLLAGLSGAKKWAKVRSVALRGWVLCSDGRYYHPVVAEKAREAQVMAKAHADQKASTNERKERERADRSRMFEFLREHEVVPDFHTTTTVLREMVAKLKAQLPAPVVTPAVTRDESQHVTAKTGQDRTGPDQTSLEDSAPNGAGPAPAAPPVDNSTSDPTAEQESKRALWRDARDWLVANGVTAKDAHGYVNTLAKENPEVIEAALREAIRVNQEPGHAKSYLNGIVRRMAVEKGAKNAPAAGAALAAEATQKHLREQQAHQPTPKPPHIAAQLEAARARLAAGAVATPVPAPIREEVTDGTT